MAEKEILLHDKYSKRVAEGLLQFHEVDFKLETVEDSDPLGEPFIYDRLIITGIKENVDEAYERVTDAINEITRLFEGIIEDWLLSLGGSDKDCVFSQMITGEVDEPPF
jgi:hypothetical protein